MTAPALLDTSKVIVGANGSNKAVDLITDRNNRLALAPGMMGDSS